jgi:hypothetical protein
MCWARAPARARQRVEACYRRRPGLVQARPGPKRRAGSCCRMCNVGQLLVLVHLDPVADVLVAVLHRVQTNTMFESLYTDVQLLRRES